jgi:hypothetical protein
MTRGWRRSRRWMAALCTAAAGEGIAAAAGAKQGSREAQRKKKRGKKRLRVHM